jgi:hypothetical protein
MEGTSDCPGEPWDTSIPRMIVGDLDTRGIDGDTSICNNEFNPPSWLERGKVSNI